MTEKAKGEIGYSLLEYTLTFARPILEAWVPAQLMAVVLDSLGPSGFNLDGVEIKTNTERPNEHQILFKRTMPAIPVQSLGLGLGKLVVTAETLEWTEAPQFIAVYGAAIDAVSRLAGVGIRSQHLISRMHIQVITRPRTEVTAPLLSPAALKLLDGDLTGSGIILLQEKSTIVIDASAAYANGLFVSVSREHPPDASLESIARVLRQDEERLFATLGLEGVL